MKKPKNRKPRAPDALWVEGGITIKKGFSNWKKALISVVLLILPLGSGVDDLIFLVLLTAAIVLVLMRVFSTKNITRKIAEWFLK